MNTIKQHVMGCVEGVIPQEAVFDTQDDLLKVEFVAAWARKPGFHRFSQDGDKLMAEFHQGRAWHVVGYLDKRLSWLPERRPAVSREFSGVKKVELYPPSRGSGW